MTTRTEDGHLALGSGAEPRHGVCVARDPVQHRHCLLPTLLRGVRGAAVSSDSLTGDHVSRERLGAVPPNFIVQPHVPQVAVLQRARAFVTHGVHEQRQREPRPRRAHGCRPPDGRAGDRRASGGTPWCRDLPEDRGVLSRQGCVIQVRRVLKLQVDRFRRTGSRAADSHSRVPAAQRAPRTPSSRLPEGRLKTGDHTICNLQPSENVPPSRGPLKFPPVNGDGPAGSVRHRPDVLWRRGVDLQCHQQSGVRSRGLPHRKGNRIRIAQSRFYPPKGAVLSRRLWPVLV